MNDTQNANNANNANNGVASTSVTSNGVTPITPIQPQVLDDSATNPTPVNLIPEPASIGPKLDVVNPIPPTSGAGTGGGSAVLMPSISMPEVKGSESNASVATSAATNPVSNSTPSVGAVNPLPQLNLETSSPFDIGVNAPINTSVSNSPQTEVKPIPVTGANNSSVAPDINIRSSMSVGSGTSEISVGTYILNIILFSIPIIGFIIALIKALGGSEIRNFARAWIVLVIIGIILSVIYVIFISAGIAAAYS